MAIRITNAAAIYTIMMLVFIVGMWMILAFGSTIEAQPDLAGEWELLPEGRGDPEPITATIEQSGRFVRMRVLDAQYDLRITSSGNRIEMNGKGVVAMFDPSPSPDVFRVTLTTPELERGRFSGRITTRTYPRTPAGNKPQTSKLAPADANPGASPSTRPLTHAH